MGSSKAKKSAKKADFQKPKLKVGKARPQASNVTNTSFRSKGIVVKDQSLSTVLPSIDYQVSSHFAHLNSRSESQRKESLAALTNGVSKGIVPSQTVLEKALPLITDGHPAVREQLLRLLQALPTDQCRGFEGKVVLYLQTGLTHIASGVYRSALDFLNWASDTYGEALVSCHGGWYKILKCLLLLLNWKPVEGRSDTTEWSVTGSAIEKLNKEPKLMVKVLETLARFVGMGLRAHDSTDVQKHIPCSLLRPHTISLHARPFARLGLFEGTRNAETQLYDDVVARRAVFDSHYRRAIERGLQVMKRQGGELGRAGGILEKAISESSVSGFVKIDG